MTGRDKAALAAASQFPRTTGLAPRLRAMFAAGASDKTIGDFLVGWLASGAPVTSPASPVNQLEDSTWPHSLLLH